MKFTLVNLPKIALALFFFTIATAFTGCNKSNSQSTSAKTENGPVIEFRRTACFGTCPIYQATVARNGKVTFTGVRFIDKIGSFEAQIPETEVQQMLTEIDKVNFFDRDTLYVTGATDLPSMILRVRNHGKYHTIRTEGEGPEEVEKLMQRIDRVIMNAIRMDGKPVKTE